MMKKIVYILFWSLLLLSCANDRLSGDADNGQEVRMKLNISTKANGVDDAISNVRIIVVNKYGDVKFNESKTVSSAEGDFFAVSREGKNDFYVICNETAAMTSALNTITKGSDLESFKIEYRSEIGGSSLVMYGEMRDVNVASTGDNPEDYNVTYINSEGKTVTGTKLPIAVKRLVVRVALSFIKSTSDFTVSDISVKVVKLPIYSYLKEGREYDGEMGALTIIKSVGEELLNDNLATFDTDTKTFKYENDDVIIFDDIYLPEYLISEAHKGDRDYQTEVIVSGKCTTTKGQVIIGNWRIGLMDLSNALPRNNWYKIAATISGMGAIGLYAEIEEVTEHNVSVNWKPQDGLVIVSDLETDYGKNVNVWNNYNVYFGILKTYNATKLTYTDVLFKYGSVVATRGSEPVVSDGVTYTTVFDADQDIMWKPRDLTISSWSGIPYLNKSDDVPSNTGNVTNGLGDPCKLVTLSAEQIERGIVDNEQWHMATAEEYETLIKANDNKSGDVRGFNTFHLLLIPNSRVRDFSGVLSADAGGKGEYWSSKGGKTFEFISDENTALIVPYANTALAEARGVRCVRNKIPESSLRLGGTTIPYSGGEGKVTVTSSLTYWKAVLITKDNVEEGETASDDNDIEFLSSLTGSHYGTIGVKLNYTPMTRRFYIRVTGISLDGKMHKEIATVTQYAASIRYLASFDPALPKNFLGSGFETTVTCNLTPNDPDRVPIPSDKPYYIWVEVYKASLYGELIFDSRTDTDGNLGMIVVPGTYQYKINIKIPANDNVDPRSIFIKINSTAFGMLDYGPIIQGKN